MIEKSERHAAGNAGVGRWSDSSLISDGKEEKDALAARLKRSPDLLDALLMTFTFFE